MADDDRVIDAAAPDDPAPVPELLHGIPVTYSFGQRVAHPRREQLVDLVRTLRDEGYLMCLDVAGVDYLAHRRGDLPEGIEPERFEVVVVLISHADRERVRLRVQVPETDPTVPTLFELHPGTEAMEREVFDMFGISFEGHPDLTRILMPEDWHGHPLRKDYAVGRIPVQFKDAPSR
ncbi:MAG: nuoC [Acidimicrobiales bacterium]|nr:nuoC [Acidimicrobiales bacterium]